MYSEIVEASEGIGRMPLLCSFIIHQTHYEKSDWSRALNQFTIAYVKFNVCLVTKPLGVSSSETKWLNAWLLLRVEDTADVQQ